MKAAIALILLSLVLVGASATLEPFHLGPDGTYPFLSVAQEDSKAYYAARTQALTPKYRLQDYGITSLTLGLALAFVSWRPLKAPGSRVGFIAIAVVAPLLTTLGFVFDLIQGQARWEFPPWADSLGIPLMGVPGLLLVGLLWAFAHFILLAGVPRRYGIPISISAIRRAHPWLLVVCLLTVLLVTAKGAEGAYWYAFPGAVWLYYYASISAVRQHDA
jgi:hypothetical protein